jgi:catechol 2,3-dioxygenase-like lactoylglutathione lyase family enzyme
MIDHIGLKVGDFAKSRAFYLAALAPLGYQVVMELPASIVPQGSMGMGVPPKPEFWISGGKSTAPVHVAFRAQTRAQVDEFHRAAIAAGGRDNGPPGLRLHYHPNYYGAFVLDPDGHNVEAVCHDPPG